MHHVQTIEDATEPGGIVVGRKPIDNEVVGEVALAADGDALTRHSRGLGEELRAGGIGGRHTRNQQCQVQEVAPVQRQALHLGLRHRAGNLAARGLQHQGVFGHGEGRLGRPQRQRNRQLIGGPDGQRQQSRHLRKPLRLDLDFVGPHSQIGKPKPSFLIGG
jgi:hypothetical protein